MLRKWLKKDRIGVALAVALLSTVFYKLNASEMDKTGRERKICPSVSQWFHAFLTANKDWSSEKFGIGQNLPSLSAVMDENESLHLLSDNLDIGFSEDVTSGESDSDDCGHDEHLTLQSEEGIIKRAHAMANIASNNFKKEQSPLFANKHFWIHAPSMLLLFSHTDYNGQGEYSDSVNKLDEIVRNNGFERMSVPGDGDCCFSSISHGLDNMLAVGDEAVSQHLQSLNIHKHQERSERNIILRELVVAEWLGENSEEFAAFLTTSEKSSFEDTAQTFLQQGIFDCELGNSVLLALCNVLKIPIVVFSSIESYPVIPLLPRESPLTFVPIYVAFNQSGKGHYDPVFATNDLPAPANDSKNSESADTRNVKIQSCCCGRGGAKDKNRSFCSTYGSRCKCFQQLQGCNSSCKCFNCGNPHGQRMGKKERQVRKRRRHDDSPLSSVAYMERKNEPLAPERLEDFELFVLQQIVSATITQSNEDATPDYDSIFKFFKQVLISAGFNNIPPCEKVKRLVDWIIRERSLFSLMLRQEVKKSWYSA